MPKISVIVPIYNLEQYLPTCIESIMQQSYTQLEIILVNDGSTDTCKKICDSYAAKDTRILVIHQENKGVAAARNRGLAAATGEFIAFVDPDDKILPNMYTQLYESLKKYHADWSQCDIWVDKEDPHAQKPHSSERVYTGEDFLLHGLQGKVHITLWCNLYKAKLWKDLRFLEGYCYEDTMLFPQLAARCAQVVRIPQKLYVYSRLNTGIVRTEKKMHHLQSKEKMLEELEKFFTTWGKHPEAAARYLCTMVTAQRLLIVGNAHISHQAAQKHLTTCHALFCKYYLVLQKYNTLHTMSWAKRLYWAIFLRFPQMTLKVALLLAYIKNKKWQRA